MFHLQAKALARVFVENHQPFQSPTSFGLVENKIVAPYMIPATSSQPLGSLLGASKPQPLVRFEWQPQSLPLPNPVHPLVIDLPTIAAQMAPDRAATSALFLGRQPQDFLH